ncbi:MAG: 5'-methylthioadenosine/adenosylhomocysteine nucleosidase [Ruminococcaceae bacterium]|nr:5'-methylthioadenosine/adenosylhomocysteine nucleosidase [Oscillospiraceae bacterium]
MIGIITAMEKEMEALSIENARVETVGGIRFTRGTVAGKEVAAAVCGIGKVFAAMCTQTLALHFHPEFIINCGVAGALAPGLRVFDLAVGTAAVQYDMDTTPLGDPLGLISGLDLVELPCDRALSEKLMDAAGDLGLHAEAGLIATADRFCGSAADKAAILEKFPAIACEMEGGAVAQVCAANKIPCCLFRAISDSADGDASVSYETFAAEAAKNAGKLMTAFLQRL